MKNLLFNIWLLFLALVFFPVINYFAFIINSVRFARKKKLSKYIKLLALAEDQKSCSYIFGTEDITISTYAYDLARKNKFGRRLKRLINFLFRDKKHCENSFLSEMKYLKEIKKI